MNKQEIEKDICVENLRHLLIDVLGNKNNEKELIRRLKEPDYKYYGCELSKGEAELAISALEKQIPKKPIAEENQYSEDYGYNSDILCPTCKAYIGYYTEAMCKPEYMQYCNECGQRIDKDWSGEDE